MRNKLKNLKDWETAQVVIWRLGSMALTALSAVITARTLGPEKIGISATVLVLTQQIATAITFLPGAYSIREYKSLNSEFARNRFAEIVLGSTCVFAVAVSFVTAVLLMVGIVPVNWRIPALSAIPLLLALTLNPGWIHQSNHRQSLQYRSQFYASAIIALLAAIYLNPESPAGVDLAISAGASCVGALHLWTKLTSRTKYNFRFGKKELKEFLRHLELSRAVYATGIFCLAYVSIEAPLIALYCGNAELGIYRAGVQWAAIYQGVLSVVPVVIYPRLIEWASISEELLWKMQLRIARTWVLIALAVSGANAFVVPLAFPVLFGADFAGGGKIAIVLTAAKFLVVLNGIFCWGLWAKGEDKKLLILFAATAGLSVAGNLSLMPKFGIVASAIINILSESIVLAGSIILAKPRRH